MLRPGEKVWDDIRPLLAHYDERLKDGSTVGVHVHGGHKRYLSRIPNPLQTKERKLTYSKSMKGAKLADGNDVFPRSEWSDRLKDQIKHRRQVSQFQKFAPHDQDGLPTCFPAGALIRMADGSDKRIEDIKPLDMVVTAQGNRCRVSRTMAKWIQDDIIEIVSPFTGRTMLVTKDHPILCDYGEGEGYESAGSLDLTKRLVSWTRDGQRKTAGLQSLGTRRFEGHVFNIEVDNDSSYIAEGVGVHNCWANGPAHAITTQRYMSGMPLVYMSACSVAVPISGGHSGGDEWDAAEYAMKNGYASANKWSNNDTSRNLNSSADVQSDRLHYKALECFQCESDDEFATACLLGYCCAIAYNWWSHVIMLCDLVEIEAGHWGFRIRNNWGDWGDKNEYGFYGYAVFPFGHGSPSSGHFYSSITQSQPTYSSDPHLVTAL